MIVVNVGDKPLADFNRPLAMMKDCHRRIEDFLAVLRTLVAKFGRCELTDEGRCALQASLDYFVNARPRHTADEEQSLFPRMRSSESADGRVVAAELDLLERDHRRGEACHAAVDQLGRHWLETGRMNADQKIASKPHSTTSQRCTMSTSAWKRSVFSWSHRSCSTDSSLRKSARR
jgi:hypothetical protein